MEGLIFGILRYLKNAASSQYMYTMTNLSEGSDASDDFVCPFCDPCCPVYTASHLIMRRREKKKLETELRHHHT